MSDTMMRHDIQAARGAVVGGWVMTGLTGLAGGGAAILSAAEADWEVSVGLGGLSLTACAVGVPVASMHGVRLRQKTLARGGRVHASGLRVASWVLYGLTMAQGSTLVALGISEEIPVPLILGTVTTGITANVLMNIDTWRVARDAESSMDLEGSSVRASRVEVAPTFGVGLGGASVGLTGRF
jgi:hypothetical protein